MLSMEKAGLDGQQLRDFKRLCALIILWYMGLFMISIRLAPYIPCGCHSEAAANSSTVAHEMFVNSSQTPPVPTTSVLQPNNTSPRKRRSANLIDSRTAQSLNTSIGDGAYIQCHNLAGAFVPFCKPTDGSILYVGGSYYVTWDATFFAPNTSIYIMVDYVNTTGGPIAYQSPMTPASNGWIDWTIERSWLQDKDTNNVTLYVNPVSPGKGDAQRYQGPSVMVTEEPPDYYRQPETQMPTGRSLYIALPTVFGFILLCVLGGCWLNRDNRRIGLGNIMGRRDCVRASESRRPRFGLGRRRGGAIRLVDIAPDRRYRDAPVNEGGLRSTCDEDLGSLVDCPDEKSSDNFVEVTRRAEQKDDSESSHARA